MIHPSGTVSPMGRVWCNAIDDDPFVSVAPSSPISIQLAGISWFFLITFSLANDFFRCICYEGSFYRQNPKVALVFKIVQGLKAALLLLLPSNRWHVLFGSVFQAEEFNVSSTKYVVFL